jgi:hypothetical protein
VKIKPEHIAAVGKHPGAVRMTECPSVDGTWIGRWNRPYLAGTGMISMEISGNSTRIQENGGLARIITPTSHNPSFLMERCRPLAQWWWLRAHFMSHIDAFA